MSDLTLGEVLKPQGIKGELKLRMLARNINDIISVQNLKLNGQSVTIETIRESNGFLYIKFREIISIADAEKYRGKFLSTAKEELNQTLEEGEYFIEDLINKPVEFESGEVLGVLIDVSNYGSADVITIKKSNGKEVLLANVEGVIINVTDSKVVFNKSKFDEVSI